MSPGSRRLIAALYGLAAHGLFPVGVGAMLLNLHQGLQRSLGSGRGAAFRRYQSAVPYMAPRLRRAA